MGVVGLTAAAQKGNAAHYDFVKSQHLPDWLEKIALKEQHYVHKGDGTFFCPVTISSTSDPYIFYRGKEGVLFNFCPMCGKKIVGWGKEEEWLKFVEVKK